MKKTIVGAICIVVLALSANGKQQNCNQGTLNTCLSSALSDIATVKPGMTREELEKRFDLSGGFFSSRETLSATYVYKESNYIKIDVEFSPAADGSTARNKDVIKTVSRPYLAYPIYD